MKEMLGEPEEVELNGDAVKVSDTDGDKIESNGHHNNGTSTVKSSESRDFEISSKFLQSVFKLDEETEGKVWKVERSDLPALVQVIKTSKERNDSQAFR